MIQLGAFDAGVSSGARDAYLEELETLTRVPLAQKGLVFTARRISRCGRSVPAC